jgi:hypothetical protein
LVNERAGIANEQVLPVVRDLLAGDAAPFAPAELRPFLADGVCTAGLVVTEDAPLDLGTGFGGKVIEDRDLVRTSQLPGR